MLHRALRPVQQGFYVDVGANDPVCHSITKAFYERGWRGINIEPVQSWFGKIDAGRSEDVNLQIAITDTDDGEADFYEVTGAGLSTLHETIAQRHAGEHGYNIEKRTVVTATLTSVLDRYAPAEIHFLNIDAEGAERAVLKGLDLAKHRPWIVLVEATLPNTQIESHGEWEPLLITRGYHFVYFDGLNRFYVADEHATLDKSFHAPANAFDDFITASAVDLDQQLNAANAELEKVKAELGEVTAEVQYVKLHLAHTTNKLRVMQRSAAWRALERIRYLTGLSS
jgi:FkbM family methyltransferase